MWIELPSKVKSIIDTITQAGYEAYSVGGCVRDSILGRVPGDWDITTSASPEQVKALFPRTVDTGIQHGTVTVMIGKDGFEVTTYRIDGAYEDSRHPTEVIFTPDLKEDLRRRDFTINAMAFNEQTGLVDVFGGIEDLENKVIRCVGDAKERFTEDALRIMRAVRFAAQLGYTIEEETKKAIVELAPTLKKISAERIRTELVKLLVSDHPEHLLIAYETGITKVILPEFDLAMETPQKHPHHCYNVGEHTMQSVILSDPDKNIRLAMLLHDLGKPECLTADPDGTTHFHGHAAAGEKKAKEILKRLRFDNDTMTVVCKLVKYHGFGDGVTPTMRLVRRAVNEMGEDIFPLLMKVKRADILAQSNYLKEEKLAAIDEWTALYEQMVEEKQCVSLKTLAVTGGDLIALGMRPGKDMGAMLHDLLEIVLEEPEKNDREYLLTLVQERLQA